MPNPEEKQARELEVAQLFCRRFEQDCGIPARILGAQPEPAADVLLDVGQQEVCLELARYRETGPYNGTAEYDKQLKDAIFNKVWGDTTLPDCSVTMRYRESRPGRYRLPRPDQRTAFIEQLVQTVRLFGAVTLASRSAIVTFVAAGAAPRKSRAAHTPLSMPAAQVPVLAEFCSSVVLRSTPGQPIGLPGSSMNCRYTHVDWNEIRRTIRAKLDNLPAYRVSAMGRSVWLLYYGEGNATGRLPGPDHNARLIEFVQGILAESTVSFDAVWWADEVYVHGGPTLYKVTPPISIQTAR